MALPEIRRPILSGTVNFPVCLAPMVGLSHIALRGVVRAYLPKDARTIWPTEMLNSRRLPNEQVGKTPETLKLDNEDGLVPQILANEPDPIAQSVQKLEAWGAQAIDINMGCPVSKALRHNYGVALMGDPGYAAEVVRMTVARAQIPVAVKLRAGFQKDSNYLTDFTRGLEGAGASWICLHPRKAEEKRRGAADWSQIQTVREALRIPVIGNGDVQTAQDVLRMRAETGCDMVMVGRALTARPWLLWQLGEAWGMAAPQGREGESAPRDAEGEGREFGRALLLFIDYLEKYFSTPDALKRLNFFMRNAHPWLEFGHALAASLTRAQDLINARERVMLFFSQPQRMSERTDLRY